MTLSVGNVQAATAAFATTTNVAPATVSPQSVAKKLNKAVRDGDNKILAIICAIFIPPLGVYLKEGSITMHFWIDLLLCCLFWLPGIIYALYIVLT